MASKKKDKKISFGKYLGLFNLIVAIILMGLIYFVNLLPFNYFIVLGVLVLLFSLVIWLLLRNEGKFKHFLGSFWAIIGIVVGILGINYLLNTMDFLKQFGFKDYKSSVFAVVVLKNSDYNDINSLNNKVIGQIRTNNREDYSKALEKLNKSIDYRSKVSEDVQGLIENLQAKKIDGFIVEKTNLDILKEEDEDAYNELKVIEEITVEVKTYILKRNTDILKDSFNIYISGIDTYGAITKVSRSDVNIVATVNPKTKKILLTNIPRDYYVKLHSFKEYDKLTHAGIYGVDESLLTLEDLLDTKISYYVKVNFSSLESIVDAIHGISVNLAYDFVSKDGYKFSKGVNELNGKEALSFVRERKAFKDGDRQRGKNQELVLTSIINKISSPAIIADYPSLLKSLDNKFMTNFTDGEITKFIKKQISTGSAWSIESISLNGTDSYDYTYSYKRNKLYVMKPDSSSVTDAQERIKSVMAN